MTFFFAIIIIIITSFSFFFDFSISFYTASHIEKRRGWKRRRFLVQTYTCVLRRMKPLHNISYKPSTLKVEKKKQENKGQTIMQNTALITREGIYIKKKRKKDRSPHK